VTFEENIEGLGARQTYLWEPAARNYAALREVETKRVRLAESEITLQFNPQRIRSAAAPTTQASLWERPCFLCPENQPQGQEAIVWKGTYKVQVNPYPIFPRHLTISTLEHTPQTIKGRVDDMLSLAYELPNFVVFYNGPHCGASAPDHAHFQAGNNGVLPIFDELAMATTLLLDDSDEGLLGFVDTLDRNLFTIETTSAQCAATYFNRLMRLLPKKRGHAEPMLNVLCRFDKATGIYCMAVFPRRKHRPDCYGNEPDQFLLSPASVEMGGLWAVPRKEDFKRLNANIIAGIYDELCITRDQADKVMKRYAEQFQP